jgi:hypothetical protein
VAIDELAATRRRTSWPGSVPTEAALASRPAARRSAESASPPAITRIALILFQLEHGRII